MWVEEAFDQLYNFMFIIEVSIKRNFSFPREGILHILYCALNNKEALYTLRISLTKMQLRTREFTGNNKFPLSRILPSCNTFD